MNESTLNYWLGVLRECCQREISALGGVKGNLPAHYLKYGDGGMKNIGALTVSIAAHTGKNCQQVRRALHQLQTAGKVLCLNGKGCISRWWPVGMAEELLNA